MPAGVHRDDPMMAQLDRETVVMGVDSVIDAGFSGLWAPDHFMLGPLVSSITYRNPALLAKMATSVDHLSEGRIRLGMGCGWHREEHERYGFDFPQVNSRIDMLEEGLQSLTSMFTEDELRSRASTTRSTRRTTNQNPFRIPIHRSSSVALVRGGSVSRHAMLMNGTSRSVPEPWSADRLEYAREEGRDPDDIGRSWLAHVLVREMTEAVENACDRVFPLPWDEEEDIDEHLTAENTWEKGQMIIGTLIEVAQRIEHIRALGFEKIQIIFLDFPETESIELFGDEVMPEFD